MQTIHAGWDPAMAGVEGFQFGKGLFYGFYIVIHNLNTVNTETMATDIERVKLITFSLLSKHTFSPQYKPVKSIWLDTYNYNILHDYPNNQSHDIVEMYT